MTDQSNRLDSWKDIAAYLGRDIRTVIRWEQERGLPVRRIPGTKVSRVFAYREELDAWLASGRDRVEGDSRPEPPEGASEPAARAQPPRFVLAAVGTAVVIGALAIPPLWGDRTLIRQVVVEGADVLGPDAAGRTRWTYRLPHTTTPVPRRGRPYQILDLDGDGQDEVLAVVATAQSPVRQVVDELYCFSQDGLLRWTWTSKARLQFRDADYGPPWSHMDMVPYTADGRTRLAIALRHYTWWPSMVVLLDPAANERVAFVSSGWIGHVGVAPDGRSLLVTGISNERGQYFLSVVDPEKPARSPERDGSPYECLGCPRTGPAAHFVFPRSEISREPPFPAFLPQIELFDSGAMQIRVRDSGDPNVAETLYEFSSTGEPQAARFTDTFWDWHRRLESAGALTHAASDCPERGRREIDRWSAGDGWAKISIPAR